MGSKPSKQSDGSNQDRGDIFQIPDDCILRALSFTNVIHFMHCCTTCQALYNLLDTNTIATNNFWKQYSIKLALKLNHNHKFSIDPTYKTTKWKQFFVQLSTYHKATSIGTNWDQGLVKNFFAENMCGGGLFLADEQFFFCKKIK